MMAACIHCGRPTLQLVRRVLRANLDFAPWVVWCSTCGQEGEASANPDHAMALYRKAQEAAGMFLEDDESGGALFRVVFLLAFLGVLFAFLPSGPLTPARAFLIGLGTVVVYLVGAVVDWLAYFPYPEDGSAGDD